MLNSPKINIVALHGPSKRPGICPNGSRSTNTYHRKKSNVNTIDFLARIEAILHYSLNCTIKGLAISALQQHTPSKPSPLALTPSETKTLADAPQLSLSMSLISGSCSNDVATVAIHGSDEPIQIVVHEIKCDEHQNIHAHASVKAIVCPVQKNTQRKVGHDDTGTRHQRRESSRSHGEICRVVWREKGFR